MAVTGFSSVEQRKQGAFIAKEAGVKQLAITHQSPELAEVANQVCQDIEKVCDGPVQWAQDFMELTW